MGIVTNSKIKNKQKSLTMQWDLIHFFRKKLRKWKSQDQVSESSKTPAICRVEMLKPISDSLYSCFRNKSNNWLWGHLSHTIHLYWWALLTHPRTLEETAFPCLQEKCFLLKSLSQCPRVHPLIAWPAGSEAHQQVGRAHRGCMSPPI